MKEFMITFLGSTYEELGLSPEQAQERMGRWFAWSQKLNAQGIEHKGHALEPTGRTVKGPDMIVSDGPFLEGKEMIGGYYIIKVADYDAAVEVAKGYPDFDLDGSVEVREIMVFEQ